MRKWAYRIDDKSGDFKINSCSLKNLKPILKILKDLSKNDISFDKVMMTKPLPTLLIYNALINAYRLADITTITIKINEAK